MNNNIPYSESVSRVTSADLGSDDTVFANVTWQLSGSSVVRAWTRFNTNSKFDWNTNGTMGLRGDGVWDADVFKVAVHEFGHWLALGDAPDEVWEGGFNAMMWFDPQGSKSSLFMDEKEGATMMYGLQTGFEVAQFLGLLPNTTASDRNERWSGRQVLDRLTTIVAAFGAGLVPPAPA